MSDRHAVAHLDPRKQKILANLARDRARNPLPAKLLAAEAPRHDGRGAVVPARQERGSAPQVHPAQNIPTPPGGSAYGAHRPHPSGNDVHPEVIQRQAAVTPTACDMRCGAPAPDPAGALRRAGPSGDVRMGNLIFHGE